MKPGMRMYVMNGQQNPYTQKVRKLGTEQREAEEREYWGNRTPTKFLPDAQNRYRGEDGRWKAGSRRSEYSGGRMGHDDGWKYKVEVSPEDRYADYGRMDGYDAYDRGRMEGEGGGRQMAIGFGESRMMHGEEEESESGYGMYEQEEQVLPLDEHTAKEWVKNMKHSDERFPRGERWPPELLKPYAQRYGIPTHGKEFWEFYAITHAMYSDFYPVGKKYGAKDGSPEFYACLAKYWLEDEDAVEDKAAVYYDYVVNHSM